MRLTGRSANLGCELEAELTSLAAILNIGIGCAPLIVRLAGPCGPTPAPGRPIQAVATDRADSNNLQVINIGASGGLPCDLAGWSRDLVSGRPAAEP